MNDVIKNLLKNFFYNMSSSNTLSPWDLSGLGMGFGLYRPRRPSYTFATQHGRQRSESYRYATRRDPEGAEAQGPDYIESALSKVRKESYLKATRADPEGNRVELARLTVQPSVSHTPQHENPPRCVGTSTEHLNAPVNQDSLHFSEGQGNQNLPRNSETANFPPAARKPLSLSRMPTVEEHVGNDALCESQNHINQRFATHGQRVKTPSRPQWTNTPESQRHRVKAIRQSSTDTLESRSSRGRLSTIAGTPTDETASFAVDTSCRGRCASHKNLIVLCVSFILIFSPFKGES